MSIVGFPLESHAAVLEVECYAETYFDWTLHVADLDGAADLDVVEFLEKTAQLVVEGFD